MSKVPKVGLRVIALLIATLTSSVLALLFSAYLTSRRPVPAPPERLTITLEGGPRRPARHVTWVAADGVPPVSDFQRDSPPAVYKVYSNPITPAIYVSFARVTDLNGLRDAERYLLDGDGHIVENGRFLVASTVRGAAPKYEMAMAQGHDSTVLLLHWLQSPGQSAFALPELRPRIVAKRFITRDPLYVGDLWVRISGDADVATLKPEMLKMADILEESIARQ